MVRLILEEGGNKRAFKLNDGTLTIGSADSCSLTLESDDVAGEHAELVIESGEVTLKPRAGVFKGAAVQIVAPDHIGGLGGTQAGPRRQTSCDPERGDDRARLIVNVLGS